MKWESLKKWAPVLAVLLVAACIGLSLGSYVAEEYDLASLQAAYEALAAETQAEDTETSVDADEEEEIVKGSFDLEDGVYTGSGTGYKGTITLAVTIENRQITAIEILSYVDDDAFFNRALTLIETIIATQSLDVDAVSGATYSSNGILAAIRNALYGEEDDTEVEATDAVEGASTTVSTVTDASAYADGTYYGSGTGFGGTLTVKVVISDGLITSITLTSHSETASYLANAMAVIDSIIAAQSTNVDTVSGATYSSVGIIEAVRDALSQAAVSDSSTASSYSSVTASDTTTGSSSAAYTAASGETPGSFPYLDGTYTGTGEGWGGDIVVSVTIENQWLTAIEVLSHEDETAVYYNRAVTVLDEVLAQQSTDVDTVSGATYSSEGILEAIEQALTAAAQATAAANGTSSAAAESSTDSSSTGSSSTGSSSAGSSSTGSSSADGDSSADNGTSASAGTYIDGTYTVSVVCEPDEDEDFDAYYLTLSVTIEDDTITAITDISGDGGSDNDRYLEWAVSGRSSSTGVVEQILNLGMISSADEVDTVSRATCSSNAIIEAVLTALAQARAKTEDVNDTASGSAADTDTGSDTAGADSEDTDDTDDTDSTNDTDDTDDTDTQGSEGTVDSVSGADAGISDGTGTSADTDTDDSGSGSEDADTGSDGTDTGTTQTYASDSYTISVLCEPDEDEDFETYHLTLTVTIEDDTITAITDISGDGDSDNDRYITWAVSGRSTSKATYTGVVEQILALGILSSADEVDAVTGATCSSNAIVEAVLAALQAALEAAQEEAV